MKIYQSCGKVAERPHLNLPKGTFEEEIGLEGFYGPVSHLYHRNPPTKWTKIEKAKFQWEARKEVSADCLKPQSFKSAPSKWGGDFFKSSRLLFWNNECAIHVHLITKSSPIYFRNADASELYFCHSGKAELDSPYGKLKVQAGDYVVVPKGSTYRWKTKGAYLLRVENFGSWYKKPETGILGQQALYHEEDISTPSFSSSGKTDSRSVVRVQNNGELSDISYRYDIRKLSGWCGSHYPYVLPTGKIAPVLSSRAHIPPSVNSTFMGSGFIVCTFLPRPLEEPKGALKVPFYHSNIDYDEFIFYHAGNFFSRDGMDVAYMTLHPRGINHGPHPKAIANQHRMTRTNEIAVMIDTEKSLKVSKFARQLENKDYWESWKK